MTNKYIKISLGGAKTLASFQSLPLSVKKQDCTCREEFESKLTDDDRVMIKEWEAAREIYNTNESVVTLLDVRNHAFEVYKNSDIFGMEKEPTFAEQEKWNAWWNRSKIADAQIESSKIALNYNADE